MGLKTYVEDILNGKAIASGESTLCTACGEPLHVGRDVTAYAVADVNDSSFQVTRVYCSSCELHTIRSATVGKDGALVRARLANMSLDQETRVTLADVNLVDWSAAEDT